MKKEYLRRWDPPHSGEELKARGMHPEFLATDGAPIVYTEDYDHGLPANMMVPLEDRPDILVVARLDQRTGYYIVEPR